jgi:hypothetical protein
MIVITLVIESWKKNDTKDRSASDINVHLEIDSDGWFKKNHIASLRVK